MCISCFAFSWYYSKIWFWACESIAVSLTLKPLHNWHNGTCCRSSSRFGKKRQDKHVDRSYLVFANLMYPTCINEYPPQHMIVLRWSNHMIDTDPIGCCSDSFWQAWLPVQTFCWQTFIISRHHDSYAFATTEYDRRYNYCQNLHQKFSYLKLWIEEMLFRGAIMHIMPWCLQLEYNPCHVFTYFFPSLCLSDKFAQCGWVCLLYYCCICCIDTCHYNKEDIKSIVISITWIERTLSSCKIVPMSIK